MWEECKTRVYACGCVFFGQATDLKRDLDERARDEACEDDAAEGVVQEGFEVALPWCYIMSIERLYWYSYDAYFQRLQKVVRSLQVSPLQAVRRGAGPR